MSTQPTSDSQLPSSDQLALARTRLANERTLLSYVRTAIMLGGTGVTIFTLYGDRSIYFFSGWSFVTAGVLVMWFGFRRFHKLKNELG